MRVAHILVCHSYDPAPLFRSIPKLAGAPWYIFMHHRDPAVEKSVLDFAYDRGAQVYFHGTNRGLAKSWNDGMFDAWNQGADAFLLLNDDIVFYDDQYQEFMRVTEIVSRAHDISYVTALGYEPYVDGGRTIPQHFACCAITRRCLEVTGCFDENFFPAYHEDVDYFIRSSRLGFHPHVEMRTLVEHRRGATSALFSQQSQAEFESKKAACGAYFWKKWDASPYFPRPFNDPDVSFNIPFVTRHAPYQNRYDRSDLPQA